jgi:hypothetical protein
VKRREFIAGLGSAVAWPLAVQAQQPAMPVIGYFSTASAGEKPTDLPVEQAVRIELTLNLKTAKALGIEFPTGLLIRAAGRGASRRSDTGRGAARERRSARDGAGRRARRWRLAPA